VSVEKNKQAVETFFAAMNSGDVDAIVNSYHDEGYLWTKGHTLISGRYSKDQVQAAAGGIYEAFPEGIAFDILHMTAEDDRVAVEATSRGMHVSGLLYENEYHFLFHLRDGKVLALKEYMDTERVTDVLCGGQRPE
jgi:ketosteroid isomerase-like protein